MKLTSSASIDVPAAQLFELFCDVERVAACLPGAVIDGRDGDDYLGSMKVRVGPITGDYQGRLRFVELDREQRRAVLTAAAEDRGGQGAAQATILATVAEGPVGSLLEVETDLQIRGRVAQFGRGGLERIAGRMFDELARNVEREVTRPGGSPRAESASPVGGVMGVRRPRPAGGAAPAQAPALDALELVVGSGGRRALRAVLPVVLAFGYGYLVGLLRGRAERRA